MFSLAGVLMWADTTFLGVDTDTHNKTKARGMAMVLQLALKPSWEAGCAGLTVLGNSNLVSSFI